MAHAVPLFTFITTFTTFLHSQTLDICLFPNSLQLPIMATKPVQMHHITAHPSGPIEPQSDEKLNLAPNIAIGKQFWFNGVLPGDAAPAAPPPIHDQTALNLDLYRGNVVYRVSTTRIPEDQSGIKLERLAQMLDRELNGTREWDVGSLITDLFTDKALGVEVCKLIYSKIFCLDP